MQPNGRAWAIDHAFAFDYQQGYTRPNEAVAKGWSPYYGISGTAVLNTEGVKIPQDILDSLDVEEGDIRAALAPLKDKQAIDAVIWRWNRIQEYGKIPRFSDRREFWREYGTNLY